MAISISSASLRIAGALKVLAGGNAVAHAGIRREATEIALIGFGVMICKSYANGVFTAAMRNSGDIEAESLSVRADYLAASTARTSQPTGGITVTLLDVNTNISRAEVGAEGKAGVDGSGSLSVFSDAEICANGTINAEADALTANTLIITAVRVAVNEVESFLNADQSAWLNLTGDNSTVGGRLTVDSTLSGGASKATTAGSAGPKKGVTLTLVGVDVNSAKAHSTTVNSASITDGTYTVGSLKLNAVSSPSVSCACI